MTYEVQELILELKKENQDILMVSHHLPFVKKITDQVLFISDGKIRESGPTEALFSNPRSQQAQDYMSKVLAY